MNFKMFSTTDSLDELERMISQFIYNRNDALSRNTNIRVTIIDIKYQVLLKHEYQQDYLYTAVLLYKD